MVNLKHAYVWISYMLYKKLKMVSLKTNLTFMEKSSLFVPFLYCVFKDKEAHFIRIPVHKWFCEDFRFLLFSLEGKKPWNRQCRDLQYTTIVSWRNQIMLLFNNISSPFTSGRVIFSILFLTPSFNQLEKNPQIAV